jgi:hypothetical protein
LFSHVQSLLVLRLTPLLRSAAHEDMRLRIHWLGHATDFCHVMVYRSHGTNVPTLGAHPFTFQYRTMPHLNSLYFTGNYMHHLLQYSAMPHFAHILSRGKCE